ncbi:MAG TPA: N-acetylmuramoyl-L-alanine amidase [Herpetosiphonaceae bacterium]
MIGRASISAMCLALVLLTAAWPAPSHAQSSWRVGLQVGHWRANELPDELKNLRTSTGAAAGGLREVDVNLAVANRAAEYLRSAGVTVDLLPATVPPSYRADAFVAIHADGSASSRISGWKAAAHWREWEAATALIEALRAEYGPASGLRWDGDRVTSNMRGYYAFSSRRFDHSVSTYTPAVILEMGYLTNANDRRAMTQGADRLARGVSNSILRFLRSAPAAGWPEPPPLPDLRATVIVATANLRAGPGTSYPIVRSVGRNRILMIEEERGPWLKVFSYRSRNGERWVHRDVVRLQRLSDEPARDS